MILKSEFAKVTVELDNSANGPRLMIRDDFSQRVIFLDPLELASIAWLEHEDLAAFVDPGRNTPDEGYVDEDDDGGLSAMLAGIDLKLKP